MSQRKHTETDLKNVVKRLIQAGTTFDIHILDEIYHRDLQIIMITEDGHKMLADKEAFKSVFSTKKEAGEQPLNTWAQFHHLEVKQDKGHVILSRKVNLTGEEKTIVLSIDFVWEANGWQVIREVIVPSFS